MITYKSQCFLCVQLHFRWFTSSNASPGVCLAKILHRDWHLWRTSEQWEDDRRYNGGYHGHIDGTCDKFFGVGWEWINEC